MSLDKKAIKLKIEEEIERTKLDITQLEEQVKPISPENSIGRLSRLDAINNKSVAENSLAKSNEKLQKLLKSLSKIDDDNFGICVRCNNPIPLGRIMLMPQATKCVNCA